MVYPAAVILLGARAWTSLVGIVLIVVGHWRADKIWDDTIDVETDGPASSTDIASAAGEFLESAYEFMDSAQRAVTNPDSVDSKRVHKLFRGPSGIPLMYAVAGWVCLAFSFLMDCHNHSGWNVGIISIISVLLTILIALVQTVIRPLAMYDRSVHEHSHFFTFALFGGYVLLGVFVLLDHNDAPFWLPLVAGASIAIAPNLLWFCSKRGDTYDRAAVRNPRPVLYNVGGPLLVAGWFMFWVAMNCIEAIPDRRYLPLYWTSRTAVAFEGAVSIFAAYWASGYAQDEHDETDPATATSNTTQPSSIVDGHGSRPFRPLKSFLFGRVMEMRMAFVVSWFMMAVSAFLPTYSAGGRFSSIILFLALAAQGFAIGVQHVLGIRAGDEHKLQKWSRVASAIFGFIVLFLFITKEFAAGLLAFLGTIAMGLGWMILQKDRKRGDFWMETGQANPSWTVYSNGVLLFTVGLLMFAWAMSIP